MTRAEALSLVVGSLVLVYGLGSYAEERTSTAPNNNPTRSVTASASLDFTVNLGKFLFLQIGTNAANSPDTIVFQGTPTIPSPITNGNKVNIDWNGTTPTLFTTNANSLAVAVKSNAGQINLKATVNSLSNGTNTLPFNNLTISSSNTGLPAPPIPSSGTGTSVNVTGTAFNNLVTDQTATWTFSYNTPNSALPGVYQGQVTFTASSP